jgi:DNA-binding protein YbaB
MVRAVANGKGELLSVRIDPEAVKGEDVEMLQDLVAAAVNAALANAQRMVQDEMQRAAGGMQLALGTPPGTEPPG